MNVKQTTPALGVQMVGNNDWIGTDMEFMWTSEGNKINSMTKTLEWDPSLHGMKSM